MKKYRDRITSFLLSLALTAGLCVPAALAAESTPPESTESPAPVTVTPKEPVESEILNSMQVRGHRRHPGGRGHGYRPL